MTEKTDDRRDSLPGVAARTTASGSETITSFRRQLDEHGARVIELAYSDLIGHAGSVLIPATDCQRVLAGVPAMADACRGEIVSASPDMRTLRFLPLVASAGALARLVCDLRSTDGEPSHWCARASLKRTIEALHRAGLSARVALECRLTTGQSAGGDLQQALEPAVATLAACRVPGLAIRLDAGSDCTGISLGSLSPLDAADALSLVREAVGRALAPEGIRATLGARAIRLELYRGKRNLFSDQPAKRDAAAAFIGGTLSHAPGLGALLRPMLRGVPAGSQAGLAPAIDGVRPAWRWERGWAAGLGASHLSSEGCVAISGLDGSGSMYLMMTGLIAAGLDGLRAASAADTQAPAGVMPDCPPDPGLALAALLADGCLSEAIGAQTIHAYAAALREYRERSCSVYSPLQ